MNTNELSAIIVHSGATDCGHFYAYIKDFEADLWLCFNDESVTVVSTLIVYYNISAISSTLWHDVKLAPVRRGR